MRARHLRSGRRRPLGEDLRQAGLARRRRRQRLVAGAIDVGDALERRSEADAAQPLVAFGQRVEVVGRREIPPQPGRRRAGQIQLDQPAHQRRVQRVRQRIGVGLGQFQPHRVVHLAERPAAGLAGAGGQDLPSTASKGWLKGAACVFRPPPHPRHPDGQAGSTGFYYDLGGGRLEGLYLAQAWTAKPLLECPTPQAARREQAPPGKSLPGIEQQPDPHPFEVIFRGWRGRWRWAFRGSSAPRRRRNTTASPSW